MSGDIEFMKFFPSKFPKGRLPDRDYFWNVMNTLMPEYTSVLLTHANEMRTTSASQALANQTIEISDDWY